MQFSPFLLEEKYNEVEKDNLINLSSACLPTLSLKQLLEFFSTEEEAKQFQEEIYNCKLDYSLQYGLESSRGLIAKNFYADLEADELMLSCGASEAILLAFTSLFQKNDSIIVQKPSYQSLYQIAKDCGVKIIDWYQQNNKRDSLAELEELIKTNPEAKALVINNPNNPLGIAFDREELKYISNLLEDRLLIADEVFLALIQNQNYKSAIDIHSNSIVISDLSKSFSLPGLRLGWLACKNKKLLEQFSSQKNYLSLRNSILSELIAGWVVKAKKQIIERNQNIIKTNQDFFFDSLPASEFDLEQNPEEVIALNCFPKLKDPNLIHKAKQDGIFLVTGELIDPNYQGYCRIGFGLEPDVFTASLMRYHRESLKT